MESNLSVIQTEIAKALEQLKNKALVTEADLAKKIRLNTKFEGKPKAGISLNDIDFAYNEDLPRYISTPDYMAYLKIGEGCDNKCTYCIIPKLRGKYRTGNVNQFTPAFLEEDDVEVNDNIKIDKTKKFAIKPMSAEEAVLQMELVGHNFFVFFDSDAEEVNVVYKRKNGTYGLIEPEFD